MLFNVLGYINLKHTSNIFVTFKYLLNIKSELSG